MRRLIVGLVALIAFGALGGYVAGAVNRPQPPPPSRGSLAALVVVRSDRQAPVDPSTPVAVRSAAFKLTVPEGRRDLFDVRFSGVAAFQTGTAFPVAIDVTVDGVPMTPAGLPAWQTGALSPVPFQVERAIGPLAPGTYDVGVQLSGATQYSHQLLQLTGWTLVSQRTSERASSEPPATHGPRATANV